ncbi:MAG: hypothetical protein U5J63_08315 [Fodinibius sp.]|nr:hypothetical protein [Fodinibius sp.]
MVANTLRTLIFILFPLVTFGQSIDLSVTQQTANNSPSTFLLEKGMITIAGGNLEFAGSGTRISNYQSLGISADRSMVSLLKRSSGKSQIMLFSSNGDTLTTHTGSTIGSGDPSLGIFSFDNGDILLRDNITNFTFFDTFGEVYNSTSISSQTEDGEQISEVVLSDNNQTLILYSPKIQRGDKLGSRAVAMSSSGDFNRIFSDTDRYLKNVTVSSNGDMIVAITAREGTEDRVVIMDRYGNTLNTISTDENLKGAALSTDMGYITLYSGGRIMVYEALTGERLGATSSSSSVFLADYFPEDNLLLALTGNYSERRGIMNGVEFRAINLEQREITSEEFSGPLGFTQKITPHFVLNR